MIYSLQLLHALRAMADIDLHFYGKQVSEIRELYRKYVWEDNNNQVNKDIRRIQSMPGFVTSYMIGHLEIERVRKMAEKELGNEFSLKDFHYEIFREGEFPLDYLEEHITAYIACKKNPTQIGCSEMIWIWLQSDIFWPKSFFRRTYSKAHSFKYHFRVFQACLGNEGKCILFDKNLVCCFWVDTTHSDILNWGSAKRPNKKKKGFVGTQKWPTRLKKSKMLKVLDWLSFLSENFLLISYHFLSINAFKNCLKIICQRFDSDQFWKGDCFWKCLRKLGFSFLILLKLFSFLCRRYSSIIWCIIFTVNKEKFSLKKMSFRKLIMTYNIPSPPTVTM